MPSYLRPAQPNSVSKYIYGPAHAFRNKRTYNPRIRAILRPWWKRVRLRAMGSKQYYVVISEQIT